MIGPGQCRRVRHMTLAVCDIPDESVLERREIRRGDFRDSYCAPLSNPGANVVDLFHAVFARPPGWMKSLLIVRNSLARRAGLVAPTTSEILRPNTQGSYVVGDVIGVWPVYALTETELVAGRDNHHLDFRLSVLKRVNEGGASVIITTICNTHNRFGRNYLRVIVPFHKWGVQQLIRRAMRAGRL